MMRVTGLARWMRLAGHRVLLAFKGDPAYHATAKGMWRMLSAAGIDVYPAGGDYRVITPGWLAAMKVDAALLHVHAEEENAAAGGLALTTPLLTNITLAGERLSRNRRTSITRSAASGGTTAVGRHRIRVALLPEGASVAPLPASSLSTPAANKRSGGGGGGGVGSDGRYPGGALYSGAKLAAEVYGHPAVDSILPLTSAHASDVRLLLAAAKSPDTAWHSSTLPAPSLAVPAFTGGAGGGGRNHRTRRNRGGGDGEGGSGAGDGSAEEGAAISAARRRRKRRLLASSSLTTTTAQPSSRRQNTSATTAQSWTTEDPGQRRLSRRLRWSQFWMLGGGGAAGGTDRANDGDGGGGGAGGDGDSSSSSSSSSSSAAGSRGGPRVTPLPLAFDGEDLSSSMSRNVGFKARGGVLVLASSFGSDPFDALRWLLLHAWPTAHVAEATSADKRVGRGGRVVRSHNYNTRFRRST